MQGDAGEGGGVNRAAQFARGVRLEWLSLPLLLLLWQVAALLAQSRFLPSPLLVGQHVVELALHGHLIEDFARTLRRAVIAFVVAMLLGGALGFVLGRVRVLDRLFGPWVVVGLNLPAIVIAILCYIWLGLSEFALILAVVINKTPLVITTIREGVRSFRPEYDELARAFRMTLPRRLRLIHLPQLMPFILTAARTGMALIWKMVLVFEVLGSDGGVGFRVGIFFQFFDMAGILSYTTVFVAMVMLFEHGVLRPVERGAMAWRLDRK
jgi:NitT/TauT family transport system permease protein